MRSKWEGGKKKGGGGGRARPLPEAVSGDQDRHEIASAGSILDQGDCTKEKKKNVLTQKER